MLRENDDWLYDKSTLDAFYQEIGRIADEERSEECMDEDIVKFESWQASEECMDEEAYDFRALALNRSRQLDRKRDDWLDSPDPVMDERLWKAT